MASYQPALFPTNPYAQTSYGTTPQYIQTSYGTTPQYPEATHGMSTTKKLLILGAIVIVIILLFAGGYGIYDVHKNSTTTSGPTGAYGSGPTGAYGSGSTAYTPPVSTAYTPPVPTMTYNTNAGYNIISGLITSPGQSTGGITFGGTVASEAACQSLCGSASGCAGYQYMDNTTGSYANGCYLLGSSVAPVAYATASGYYAGTINAPIPSSFNRTPNTSRTYGYASPGQSSSTIKYYGSMPNEVSCANTCDQDSFCQAYEWYDPSAQSPWALGCYGVSTGWTDITQTGTYSGLL